MFRGLSPTGNGDPGTCVSAPLLASMENTEISKDPEFPTYKNAPAASMTSKVGAVPALVRGVTSVSPPPLAIVNSEMLPGNTPGFAAYRNFFDGCNARDRTDGPAVIGLPARAVSA